MNTREQDLIAWIAARAEKIGDDCAVLECPGWGTLLVTTDPVVDGVHADWKRHGPAAFGYKAVARGLSDVAAMGGKPLWALLAAALPPGTSLEAAREFFLGAERAGVALVGGDTSSAPVAFAVATVLGRAHATRGPVLRSEARPGDWIVVSGPLGGSLDSGWHLAFRPRTEEALRLVETCDVGAMIDVSDGLGRDLHHILEASGVGCRLEADRIPIRAGSDLAGALGDGEDYELLATVRPGPLPAPFVRVGEITARAGEALLVRADGTVEGLPPHGYEHRT